MPALPRPPFRRPGPSSSARWHDDLDDAFAWKEERTVSINLTLQYDQVLFILEPTGIARSLGAQAGHGPRLS